VGSGEDPKKLPEWLSLSVDHPKTDSHIRLKTKGDDNKNTYLINRDGNFRLSQHGVGDVFGVNHDGQSFFHSDNTHIPLKVSSKQDSHIQLTTKGDDAKNIYLINRDGHFRVHSHGVGDMFGVNHDGHHYIRHVGDHIMHLEGDGNNPYISLGKTGKWGKSKWYLQNRNANDDNVSDFCIGRHDEGCKAIITKDGVLKVNAIEIGDLKLSNTDHSLRIQNPNGYIDIGTKNGGWGHIYSDRPKFAFNKQITDVSADPYIDYSREGKIEVIDQNPSNTWQVSRMTAEQLGGRLPSLREVKKFIEANKNQPLINADMWVPINDTNDYASVGNVEVKKRLGNSHKQLFGIPNWANSPGLLNAGFPFRSKLLIVRNN